MFWIWTQKHFLTFAASSGCLPTPKKSRMHPKRAVTSASPGETYYQWKWAYGQQGEKALINSKPCPQNLKLRILQAIADWCKVPVLQGYTNGKEVKRFQYTAIDDATRARALYIYDRHSRQNAIDFVDKVRARFPFRIHTIQTDNGHEFQALFHWHCEYLGIRHVYIRKASLHLNGKVERSHLTDQAEFYQLIGYVDDIDIQRAGWVEGFL